MSPSKTQHSWNVSAQEAIKIQKRLKREIDLSDALERLRLIAGVDVAVSQADSKVFAAAVVLEFGSLSVVSKAFCVARSSFPYVPGLLSFREGPAALKVLQSLKPPPDLVMFDGQGVAHPRRMGIATHLGVLLDIPTIGCAKSRLAGEYVDPGMAKGERSDLTDQGERIGVVLRTRDNVRPVFVSPGHKVGFEAAAQAVLACCKSFRLPEPIRQAHLEAGKLKRSAFRGAKQEGVGGLVTAC
jgi:deoxyribonuclease V